MIFIIARRFLFIVYESPWPFLVSTASLFLTLDAVLFFSSDTEFSYCVVSFMSLVKKVKPKVLYLGGSVLLNNTYNRNYSFRSIGIGKAKWNPDNYSVETQGFISKFLDHLNKKDNNSAYDVMYAVLGNKDGFFTQNYGKVTSVINNMIYFYNEKNPQNQITEKSFLDRYGFKYEKSELNFLDKTNRGTIMSNINEILAPKVVMLYNQNMIVERCISIENKINLSFQKNPEYTVGLFVRNIKNQFTLVVYDSDLKITEDFALNQKYLDLLQKQNINVTLIGKENFGMNIVIVASRSEQNSEIIFKNEQIQALIKIIDKLSKEYPEQFINFDKNSEDFINFVKTGKASYLNKINAPIPRYYRPIEHYKLPHDDKKFEDTSTYKLIADQQYKRDFLKLNLDSDLDINNDN